ncbi:MAG: hypothetical protein R2879_07740 [Saprospiraceae bacterium]
MRSFCIAILFSSISFIVYGQSLDYLGPIGFKLLNDIREGSSAGYLDKEMMTTFSEKVLFPQMEQRPTAAEKTSAIQNAMQSGKSAYTKMANDIRSLMESNDYDVDFDSQIWSYVPMQNQIHEFRNEFYSAEQNKGKQNISTILCYFSIGDNSKRMIIPVTILSIDDKQSILEIKEPISQYSFPDGDYGILYERYKQLVEVALKPADLVNGSPLFGKNYNEEWSYCSVQMIGESSPTLIKSLSSSETFGAIQGKLIQVKMIDGLSLENAGALMSDLICVFAEEFTIDTNDGNSNDIKIYTRQALTEDEKTGVVSSGFQVKNGSGDRVILDLSIDLEPTGKDKHDVFLRFKTRK